MAIHLPIGSLKTRSGLEPLPRMNPVPTSPLADDITTAPSGLVNRHLMCALRLVNRTLVLDSVLI